MGGVPAFYVKIVFVSLHNMWHAVGSVNKKAFRLFYFVLRLTCTIFAKNNDIK